MNNELLKKGDQILSSSNESYTITNVNTKRQYDMIESSGQIFQKDVVCKNDITKIVGEPLFLSKKLKTCFLIVFIDIYKLFWKRGSEEKTCNIHEIYIRIFLKMFALLQMSCSSNNYLCTKKHENSCVCTPSGIQIKFTAWYKEVQAWMS